MKKILIPTDFSEENQVGLQWSAEFARKMQAEIVMLHAWLPPIIPGDTTGMVEMYGTLYQEHRELANRKMQELCTSSVLEGVTVHSEILESITSGIGKEIARIAANQKADLLVTTSKHKDNLERLLVGTELLRLVRHSSVPVLCLSQKPPQVIRRLLFATDFSVESRKQFPGVQKVAELFQADLLCAYINTPGGFLSERQHKEHCRAFYEKFGLQAVSQMIQYDDHTIADGIIHCAEDHLADAILLITHGRKGLSRMFAGSITEEVILNTHLPVISLNLDAE